jgi:hypothetical protein
MYLANVYHQALVVLINTGVDPDAIASTDSIESMEYVCPFSLPMYVHIILSPMVLIVFANLDFSQSPLDFANSVPLEPIGMASVATPQEELSVLMGGIGVNCTNAVLFK